MMDFLKDIQASFGAMRHNGKITSHKSTWLILVVTILALFILLRIVFAPAKKTKTEQETTVVVALAQKKEVPVYLNALGAVTATDTITVKSQVNGILQKILFKEGQMIRKGAVLALIDPRPYEAQLQEFEGQLARDRALLDNARVDLKRYQMLWKEDSIAKQTLDTQVSLVQQLEGTVKADQGLVMNAKVNLGYTKITSPINGRLGLRLVDPGNFVQTTDTTGLFVINNVRPITVVFTIPEDNVPQVISQIRKNKSLLVQAYDRTQNKLLAKGALFALDNQIDPTTGTLKLKAQFQNKDDSLFPNQFVNIRLLIETLHNAIVIPTPAVLHSTQGDYVYVLDSNKTNVHSKPIKTTYSWGDNTVVSEGILETEYVIIEGTDKLTDGAKVVLANNTPAAKE
ncbi:MAG: MdtA/MuxA family multidrug efflux RND transporter periplasmic adaptor subunit [Proteobacteria bacterium]|nr:MdtA/MuxA family multidrug efflux RND transporter periplasmic adaptor subunit [Pseudomonadota bacterium]